MAENRLGGLPSVGQRVRERVVAPGRSLPRGGVVTSVDAQANQVTFRDHLEEEHTLPATTLRWKPRKESALVPLRLTRPQWERVLEALEGHPIREDLAQLLSGKL